MGADADPVRRLTEEVYLGGNVDLIDELIADDFVDHDPVPETTGDREGTKAGARMIVEAFSDRGTETDEYLDTVDGRVVANWVFTGTHTGEFAGMPPSNQTVRIRGIDIWRCRDGTLVEHWGAVDISDVVEKAVG